MQDVNTLEVGLLFEHAAAAQDRLVDALAEMHEVQTAALLGKMYDSSEYDMLIERYRRAKCEAETARAAWEQARQSRANITAVDADTARHWRRVPNQTPAAAEGMATPLAVAVTPRLSFARWLYLTGYISG
jgi:hypothetical protein